MKKNNTINKAILKVLEIEKRSMSANEIYSRIVELDLYSFKAANPTHVVLTQLRRHCIGLDFPTAHKEKLFKLMPNGTYFIKDKDANTAQKVDKLHLHSESLIAEHKKYTSEFRKEMLLSLMRIKPEEFEIFSRNLLIKYGFIDVKVTKRGPDGGIDGYGKLKVGISHFNVAFQSKRWRNTAISRGEIDKFRGAIQGDFEQGIFITTSTFSKKALNATTKSGAVPIALIDGPRIIEIMIEKSFGIDKKEELPIYINALDEVLTEE